jgi:hypothetical protein
MNESDSDERERRPPWYGRMAEWWTCRNRRRYGVDLQLLVATVARLFLCATSVPMLMSRIS